MYQQEFYISTRIDIWDVSHWYLKPGERIGGIPPFKENMFYRPWPRRKTRRSFAATSLPRIPSTWRRLGPAVSPESPVRLANVLRSGMKRASHTATRWKAPLDGSMPIGSQFVHFWNRKFKPVDTFRCSNGERLVSYLQQSKFDQLRYNCTFSDFLTGLQMLELTCKD